MIEIIYNKENDKKDEYLRLPKNIRQIGIPDETRKIYIEDYAITFINQFAFKNMEESKAAVLVGYTTYHNSCEYIFISGVVEADDVIIETENIEFTEQSWTSIYSDIKKYFPTLDIVGWFLSAGAFQRESSDHIIKAHIDHFAGSDKVFMKIDPLENEEIFYVFQNSHFVRQMGYYIYYEKNEEMQEYMIQEKEKVQEEKPLEQVEDHAAKSFRTIIQERKDEKHQKKMVSFMYTTSTFLAMIVIVIGITMINNYDKMKSMEQTLNSISQVVNKEEDKISNDWFADSNEQSQQDSQKESTSNLDSNNNAQAAQNDDATQEAMNHSAIPVENVSGGVEKQDTTNEETTSQEAANQVTANQEAANQEAANQEAANQEATDQEATDQEENGQDSKGTVTEINSSEEEMKQVLEESDKDNSSKEQSEETQKEPEPQKYTVQKGDTLAKISLKLYNTKDMVKKICELNNIENDNKIQAGQTILLP